MGDLKIGDKSLAAAYIGTTPLSAIHKGGEKHWPVGLIHSMRVYQHIQDYEHAYAPAASDMDYGFKGTSEYSKDWNTNSADGIRYTAANAVDFQTVETIVTSQFVGGYSTGGGGGGGYWYGGFMSGSGGFSGPYNSFASGGFYSYFTYGSSYSTYIPGYYVYGTEQITTDAIHTYFNRANNFGVHGFVEPWGSADKYVLDTEEGPGGVVTLRPEFGFTPPNTKFTHGGITYKVRMAIGYEPITDPFTNVQNPAEGAGSANIYFGIGVDAFGADSGTGPNSPQTPDIRNHTQSEAADPERQWLYHGRPSRNGNNNSAQYDHNNLPPTFRTPDQLSSNASLTANGQQMVPAPLNSWVPSDPSGRNSKGEIGDKAFKKIVIKGQDRNKQERVFEYYFDKADAVQIHRPSFPNYDVTSFKLRAVDVNTGQDVITIDQNGNDNVANKGNFGYHWNKLNFVKTSDTTNWTNGLPTEDGTRLQKTVFANIDSKVAFIKERFPNSWISDGGIIQHNHVVQFNVAPYVWDKVHDATATRISQDNINDTSPFQMGSPINVGGTNVPYHEGQTYKLPIYSAGGEIRSIDQMVGFKLATKSGNTYTPLVDADTGGDILITGVSGDYPEGPKRRDAYNYSTTYLHLSGRPGTQLNTHSGSTAIKYYIIPQSDHSKVGKRIMFVHPFDNSENKPIGSFARRHRINYNGADHDIFFGRSFNPGSVNHEFYTTTKMGDKENNNWVIYEIDFMHGNEYMQKEFQYTKENIINLQQGRRDQVAFGNKRDEYRYTSGHRYNAFYTQTTPRFKNMEWVTTNTSNTGNNSRNTILNDMFHGYNRPKVTPDGGSDFNGIPPARWTNDAVELRDAIRGSGGQGTVGSTQTYGWGPATSGELQTPPDFKLANFVPIGDNGYDFNFLNSPSPYQGTDYYNHTVQSRWPWDLQTELWRNIAFILPNQTQFGFQYQDFKFTGGLALRDFQNVNGNGLEDEQTDTRVYIWNTAKQNQRSDITSEQRVNLDNPIFNLYDFTIEIH